MAQALFYSSNAVAMTLAASVASGDVTCNLSSTSGLPASFPFKLLIGWSTGQQEVVHCTGLSGVVATIVRGQDGTTAQAHSIGAAVVHGVSAREFNDLELHVGSTSAVHGVTGNVVGDSDVQDLTNKTVSGAPIVGTTSAQTLTNKTLSPSAAAGVGLTVKGLASQSGHLQEWQTSAGSVLGYFDVTGDLSSTRELRLTRADAAPGVITSGGLRFITDAATGNIYTFDNVVQVTNKEASRVPSIVRGAASQSGDLQQWQNSAGTVLAKIDPAGNLSVTNTWTTYTPTFTNCTSPAGIFAYMLLGKTLFIRGHFTAGTATANGVIRFSLPISLTVPTTYSQPLPGVAGQVGTTFAAGLYDGTNITTTASPGLGASIVGYATTGVIQVN